MKKKDLVYLVIAAVILLAAGYLAFTKLGPKKSAASQVQQVEVIGAIMSDLDQPALDKLTNPQYVRDYNVEIDINSGVNNAAVFGK